MKMLLILCVVFIGVGGYFLWKELEARHYAARTRDTDSFSTVATQAAIGFGRRGIIALCFSGGFVTFLYFVSPDSMNDTVKLLASIVDRVRSNS